jgi:hypothetical protein
MIDTQFKKNLQKLTIKDTIDGLIMNLSLYDNFTGKKITEEQVEANLARLVQSRQATGSQYGSPQGTPQGTPQGSPVNPDERPPPNQSPVKRMKLNYE